MSRYYFDVSDGEKFVDTEGVEFINAEAMEEDAMRAAGGMLSDMVKFPGPRGWSMTIRDDVHNVIATLVFDRKRTVKPAVW